MKRVFSSFRQEITTVDFWALFVLNSMLIAVGLFYIFALAMFLFWFITLPLPHIILPLGVMAIYYIGIYHWKKRFFTLENGTWVERFLHKKAKATVDFLPYVTFKTLIIAGLISILPAFWEVPNLMMFSFQILVGLFFLPFVKYQFVADKIGHFDCAYTIDPSTRRIKPNGLFVLNFILAGMSGFAYFGLLIATLKLNYANLLSMLIQTIG